MKKIFGVFLFLVLATFAPALMAADVLVHPEAQIEITVPDKWTKDAEGDVLKIKAPDGEMGVAFTVLAAEQADKALETIDAELEKALGAIKWENEGKATAEKINEMPCEIWNGTAQEGKLQIECIVVDCPSGKNLAIYWFDTPESEKKYEADIDVIVKGLKPVAAPAAAPAAEPAPAPAPAATEEAGDEE